MWPVVERAIAEQYDRIFGALTAPTFAIPGNVDLPRLWPAYARPGLDRSYPAIPLLGSRPRFQVQVGSMPRRAPQ